MANKNIKQNHFDVDPAFEETDLDKNILVDKVDKVMKQKFSFLIQVYLNKAYETGYNSSLAFRVISLYLHCEFKNNEEGLVEFNLVEEVERFINCQLAKGAIDNIRRCMDLLIIK